MFGSPSWHQPIGFSKFDDMEVVPDSWDMLEKMGEVECGSVKERAVVEEQ